MPDVCGRSSKVILRVVAAVDLGDVVGRAVVPFAEEVAWTAAARQQLGGRGCIDANTLMIRQCPITDVS